MQMRVVIIGGGAAGYFTAINHAKINKDNWILKHNALGKSKSIYAGIVTTAQDWDEIFKKENLNDFVLQRWVPQNKIKGKILDQEYEDYVTGTLLFFNNNYFGLGPFRTSSFPVTNIVDDRKATSIILAHDLENGKDLFSNYIDS